MKKIKTCRFFFFFKNPNKLVMNWRLAVLQRSYEFCVSPATTHKARRSVALFFVNDKKQKTKSKKIVAFSSYTQGKYKLIIFIWYKYLDTISVSLTSDYSAPLSPLQNHLSSSDWFVYSRVYCLLLCIIYFLIRFCNLLIAGLEGITRAAIVMVFLFDEHFCGLWNLVWLLMLSSQVWGDDPYLDFEGSEKTQKRLHLSSSAIYLFWNWCYLCIVVQLMILMVASLQTSPPRIRFLCLYDFMLMEISIYIASFSSIYLIMQVFSFFLFCLVGCLRSPPIRKGIWVFLSCGERGCWFAKLAQLLRAWVLSRSN